MRAVAELHPECSTFCHPTEPCSVSDDGGCDVAEEYALSAAAEDHKTGPVDAAGTYLGYEE